MHGRRLLWVLYVTQGSATGRSFIQESHRLCFVIVGDPETSRKRRPWPALGCCATDKKFSKYLIHLLLSVSFVHLSWQRSKPFRCRLALFSNGHWYKDDRKSFSIRLGSFVRQTKKRGIRFFLEQRIVRWFGLWSQNQWFLGTTDHL